MIDTIRAQPDYRYRMIGKKNKEDWDWQVKEWEQKGKNGIMEMAEYITVTHKETGLSCRFRNYRLSWVQVALPRMIHPSFNGYLINSQRELDKAVKRMLELMGEVAIKKSDFWKYTRIDLTLHHVGSLEDFIRAFYFALRPKQKRHKARFDEKLKTFYSKVTGIETVIYDKVRHRLKDSIDRPGNIIRIEFRITTKLKRLHYFGHSAQMSSKLSFKKCLKVYENLLMDLTAQKPEKLDPVARRLANQIFRANNFINNDRLFKKHPKPIPLQAKKHLAYRLQKQTGITPAMLIEKLKTEPWPSVL